MFDAKKLLDLIASGQFGAAGEALTTGVNESLATGKTAAGDTAAAAKEAATGAANQTSDALANILGQAQEQFKGTQAGDYMGKAKDLVQQNPVGTLATLGGLAALLIGTSGGRAATGGLARVGGLAAIGGLAYKAFRNYQEGKPLTQGVPGLEQLTAPQDTPFSAEAHTNETATVILRTLVATAAADGVVDVGERAQIVGQLKGAGLDDEAAEFIESEIRTPATPAQIAAAVGSSQELALQAYAAARLIANSPQEKAFVQSLAGALQLDPALIAHFDATAGTAASAN